MITTNNLELAEKCRLLRAHGQTEKYYHPALGLNYRMTDIVAAIGIEQLKRLDGFIEERRHHAAYLTERLAGIFGIQTPKGAAGAEHSYHQYTILVDIDQLGVTRDEFAAALLEQGVGVGVHYPYPLNEQPAFAHLAGGNSLPVAKYLAERVLSLPVHPALGQKDLDAIIGGIEAVVSMPASLVLV